MDLKNKNKKAIGPIVVTVLLLAVVVSSGFVLSDWFSTFQSDFNSKSEFKSFSGKLEVLEIKSYDNTQSLIKVRNLGKSYQIVSKVLLNDRKCLLTQGNIVENIDILYLNCSVSKFTNYNVYVFSDKGIFSKTIYLK